MKLTESESAQLRACFEVERARHPDWPPTFEAAISSALVLAMLRLYVRHPEAMRTNRTIPLRQRGASFVAAPISETGIKKQPRGYWWQDRDD